MKIAIAASGNSLDSEVDQRFGRAPFFLVVDLDAATVSTIDNRSSVGAQHGAGVGAGQKLCDEGVSTVYAGSVGPKASSVLQSAGISVKTGVSGLCRDVVAALRDH